MSGRQINESIEIDAPPSVVWQVLTDTAVYSEWNPFITQVSGSLEVGSTLSVRMAPAGGRAVTIRPVVTVVDEGRELRWLGRLLVRGVFDGEHRFQVSSLPDGRTQLVQSEQFSGVLVRPLGRMLATTQQAFVSMNVALKARAEERVRLTQ